MTFQVERPAYHRRVLHLARFRVRRASASRDAVVRAARAVFERDPESGLDAVAVEAGVPRRVVLRLFPTRDDLVAELAETAAQRLVAALEAVHHDDPLVELALLGGMVWDAVEYRRGNVRRALRGRRRDRIRPSLVRIEDRLRRTVERCLAAGYGRRDRAPEATARLIAAAAVRVLDDAHRQHLGRDEGRRLLVLAGLGVLGLSWQQAAAVASEHARTPGLPAPPAPA